MVVRISAADFKIDGAFRFEYQFTKKGVPLSSPQDSLRFEFGVRKGGENIN